MKLIRDLIEKRQQRLDFGKCSKCNFNCENNHTIMNDCNVGSYYAEKGLIKICYRGELWEPIKK